MGCWCGGVERVSIGSCLCDGEGCWCVGVDRVLIGSCWCDVQGDRWVLVGRCQCGDDAYKKTQIGSCR